MRIPSTSWRPIWLLRGTLIFLAGVSLYAVLGFFGSQWASLRGLETLAILGLLLIGAWLGVAEAVYARSIEIRGGAVVIRYLFGPVTVPALKLERRVNIGGKTDLYWFRVIPRPRWGRTGHWLTARQADAVEGAASAARSRPTDSAAG